MFVHDYIRFSNIFTNNIQIDSFKIETDRVALPPLSNDSSIKNFLETHWFVKVEQNGHSLTFKELIWYETIKEIVYRIFFREGTSTVYSTEACQKVFMERATSIALSNPNVQNTSRNVSTLVQNKSNLPAPSNPSPPELFHSDVLCSTTAMLAEAKHFLEKATQEPDSCWSYSLQEYRAAVAALEEHPNDRHRRFNFYLQYSGFILHYTPEGDPVDEGRTYWTIKKKLIKDFLACSDLTPEDLCAPLFDYGSGSWPLLEQIAGWRSPELLELALRKGCSPNQQSNSKFGNTPLTWSIANNDKLSAMKIINFCNENKINIDLNLPSLFNLNTPLILCIAKGHERANEMPNFELTQFLLEKGAKPNIADARGNTPLHYACLRREASTIGLLLKWGADINATNQNGETPRDFLKWSFERSKALLFEVTNGHDQDSCSFYASHCSPERTQLAEEMFGSNSSDLEVIT